MIDGFRENEGPIEPANEYDPAAYDSPGDNVSAGLDPGHIEPIHIDETARDTSAILDRFALTEGAAAEDLGTTSTPEADADADLGEMAQVIYPADKYNPASQVDDHAGEADETESADQQAANISASRHRVEVAFDDPALDVDTDGNGTDAPTDNLPPTGGDGIGDTGAENEDKDPGEAAFTQLTEFMRFEDDIPASVDEAAELSNGFADFADDMLLGNAEAVRHFRTAMPPKFDEQVTIEHVSLRRDLPSRSYVSMSVGNLSGSPLAYIYRLESKLPGEAFDSFREGYRYMLDDNARLVCASYCESDGDNHPQRYVGPREFQRLKAFIAAANVEPRNGW